MGLGKPQLHSKIENADFICYGHTREFVFKRQIRFLSHPSGELGVTYVLHLQLVGKHVDNFLFEIIAIFHQLLRLRRNEQILVEVGAFQRRVGHSEGKFLVEGDVAPNHCWYLKTRVFFYITYITVETP